MLQLANRDLRVDLLDPAEPEDVGRQGWRYCWGGYIWQVTDAKLGPLVTGPSYPSPTPSVYDGQGLPESFRHTRRDTLERLTWRGKTGLAVGAGILAATPGTNTPLADSVRVTEPCRWTVTPGSDRCLFCTRQAAAGFSYELSRTVELRNRILISSSELTNHGEAPLSLQWFPHPFWALTGGRARIALPAGTTLPDNPGFAVAPDGTLSFKRAFLTASDSQFALLSLPPGQKLSLSIDHPKLARITFATSFVPAECPVWANAHTISVEPYLHLSLAPGEIRRWQVEHGFEI